MKNVKLFLLILLAPLLLTSQTNELLTYTYINKSIIYEFRYSPCLKPILDEYFNNKELNKLELDNLCDLKAVFHQKITGQYAGAYGVNIPIYGGPDKVILINESIPEYLPTFISAVFYHEMFHQLLPTLEHCEGKRCCFILRDGSGIVIEDVIKTFNAVEKKKYFKYISKKQKD